MDKKTTTANDCLLLSGLFSNFNHNDPNGIEELRSLMLQSTRQPLKRKNRKANKDKRRRRKQKQKTQRKNRK